MISIRPETNSHRLAITLSSLLGSGVLPQGETELILCKEGSLPRETEDVIQSHARRKVVPVRILEHHDDISFPDSFQDAVMNAQGDYLMPFLTDDFFVPFNIEESCRFLDEHDRICASYGRVQYFDLTGNVVAQRGSEYSVFTCLIDPRMTFSGMLIRRGSLLKSGGFIPFLARQTYPALNEYPMYLGLAEHQVFFYEPSLRAFSLYLGDKPEKAHFQEEKSSLFLDFRNRYPEQWKAILNCQTFHYTEEQRFAMMLLLGSRLGDSKMTAKDYVYVCQCALQIVVNDYGPLEFLQRGIQDFGTMQDALRLAMQLFVQYRDSLAISQNALAKIIETGTSLQWKGMDVFKTEQEKMLNELFMLSDEQRDLFRNLLGLLKQS